MKIAVVAANGRVGRLVVKEAVDKGYEVVAFVRNEDKTLGIQAVEKDIMDLKSEDFKGFDAVISAFGVWEEKKFGQQSTVIEHLADTLSNSETRLLIVGGAGSLYTDESLKIQLIDTPEFPKEYLALATASSHSLDLLRKREDVKWTYLSPAGFFDAEGIRTGEYKLGGEVAIVNSKGESYISYADFAIAMVDELKNKSYIQKRFSVVGENR